MKTSIWALLFATSGCALPAASLAAGTDPKVSAVEAIMAGPAFRKAQDYLAQDHDRIVREIITITETPAPTFKEQARAQTYLAMLREAGLSNVASDEVGNAIGVRKGTGGGPVVVVSAHLDTVFPEGTDVRVKRDGTRLAAPGISDDSRGLAVLLAYARAMDAADIRTASDIVFLGTVGEEGAGNLRGVRYFFEAGPYKGRVKAFFSVDGIDPAEITNGGAGSIRYHVVFKGPGGHSFRAFGTVTPVAAMARAISGLYAVPVPADPKTTYAVGVVAGGTSVNSIPSDATMDVDLRSQDRAELERLDARFRTVVSEAVAEENRVRATQTGTVTADLELIGRRPTGVTAPESEIAQHMTAAAKLLGYTPRLETRATDANLPMSLGIPALGIGAGGTGGRNHSLDEYIDVEPLESVRGMSVGLAALLATAGAH